MTAGPPVQDSSAEASAPPSLIPTSWLTSAVSALAGLTFVWLPLATVAGLDSLRSAFSWSDIGLTIARLHLLLAFATVLLVSISWLLRILLGGRSATAYARTWLAIGLPVAAACGGQFAYNLVLWLGSLAGSTRFAMGLSLRVLLLAAAATWLASWLRRRGTIAVATAIAAPWRALQWPAAAALLLSAGVVSWDESRRLAEPATPAVVTAASAEGSTAARPERPPDVLLISLDSLAFNDAALCGQGPTGMPRLRRLAVRSSCFTHLYASANTTVPATSTIATGTLPWTHWGQNLGGPVAPALLSSTLGERLKRAGYQTHSVSAARGASPYQHGTWQAYDTVSLTPSRLVDTLFNASTSFSHSNAVTMLLPLVSALIHPAEVRLFASTGPHPPERVLDRAWQILGSGQATLHPPRFLWLHFWPPHSPYLPPPSTKGSLLNGEELSRWSDLLTDNTPYEPALQPLIDKHRLRYRETLLDVDQQLGRFLDELEQQGRLDSALVIITADHGESFEHGFLGHAGNVLHQAVIRIPLLVKLPGQRQGRVLDLPVSQADLAPTLLDIVGVAAPDHADGRSLRPLLEGGYMEPQPVFVMNMHSESRFRPIRGGLYAVIDGAWKYQLDLAAGRGALYSTRADATESTDLAALRPAHTHQLNTLLRNRLADAERRRLAWFPN